MGAYLSEPKTNKETALEENEELRVASASMQGWRVSQEVRNRTNTIIGILLASKRKKHPWFMVWFV